MVTVSVVLRSAETLGSSRPVTVCDAVLALGVFLHPARGSPVHGSVTETAVPRGPVTFDFHACVHTVSRDWAGEVRVSGAAQLAPFPGRLRSAGQKAAEWSAAAPLQLGALVLRN